MLLSILLFSETAMAGEIDAILRLQEAYPEHIIGSNDNVVIWSDGTEMLLKQGKSEKTTQEKLDDPALIDQVKDVEYIKGEPENFSSFNPSDDPGRIRYELFFRKMYGNSAEEVRQKLVTIYWMPKIFGNNYPLLVTTVNGVDRKLVHISNELESLVAIHPEFRPLLDHPGGTFNWRYIANTNRLSPHSFGMTIDINADLSNYWQWDFTKKGIFITEVAELTYHNDIPWEIVHIFEKYNFIWGGKWHHYDTMHFEYRPEIIKKKDHVE